MAIPEFRRILVTGGAGFIGHNFVQLLLDRTPARITILDQLTYAGNRRNLGFLPNTGNWDFVKGDICDRSLMETLVADADAVVNFAAETHVDRSILDAEAFLRTNVIGTSVLLDAIRQHEGKRFVQVSTDEVYGEVAEGFSYESDALQPRNPYSASKAAAEMLVMSYVSTYGIQAMITRGANTYGPFQYPEKFIPLMVTNAMTERSLPIYGDGKQVRHWIHVRDHAAAVLAVLEHGAPGEAYNVGSEDQMTNLAVVERILGELEKPRSLIQHVTDRKGHDRRYAVSSDKLRGLGWRQTIGFGDGLAQTIAWYRGNEAWWRPLRGDSFEEYYRINYSDRSALNGSDETGT